ncbi:MAG: type II toxin-antitoxin system RelE/ParE family toxin [Candidatus Curtissbacteria bacterium]|nr:type II toxin-antitoxin system RelE/ParE family toxin [Candidatus Curtissbacteria bacterium]
MYQVFLTNEAEKQLKSLDSRYQKALAQALKRLAENTKAGAPLRRELKGKYKLRVSRYRIIYEFDYGKKIIWVLTIDHRKDVYR